MEWADLRAAVRALRTDEDLTATAVARSGAALLHHALDEMYLGEPEALRKVAWTIAQARPDVVALRNVGLSVVTTAREARAGDRMAAAARSALRLARLLNETPNALGRRAQPLLRDAVATLGYSTSIQAALLQGRERVRRVVAVESGRQDGRAAQELAASGLTVERVSPQRMDEALAGVRAVLLGCSAFLADGSTVVEKGALALIREAAARNIPVHVFADTLKLAPWLPAAAPDDGNSSWGLAPSEHVSRVVTEDGVRRPDQLLTAAADLAPRWRAFEPPSNKR